MECAPKGEAVVPKDLVDSAPKGEAVVPMNLVDSAPKGEAVVSIDLVTVSKDLMVSSKELVDGAPRELTVGAENLSKLAGATMGDLRSEVETAGVLMRATGAPKEGSTSSGASSLTPFGAPAKFEGAGVPQRETEVLGAMGVAEGVHGMSLGKS